MAFINEGLTNRFIPTTYLSIVNHISIGRFRKTIFYTMVRFNTTLKTP